jgi:hypothetical protein
MYRVTGQLKSSVRYCAAAVCFFLGAALALWVHQVDGEAYDNMMASTIADSAVQEHNRLRPEIVRNISEITADERREATLRAHDRGWAVARSEISRIRLVAVAKPVAVWCWLVGLACLAFQAARSRGAGYRDLRRGGQKKGADGPRSATSGLEPLPR